MPSAYLLVFHGSRDPRPEIAMQQLAKLVCKKLPDNEQMVGVAALELSSQPLHEQIRQFAQTCLACGCDRLKIVPLFLLPGVHVITDIPTEVALAQQAIAQDMIIDLLPYVGTHPSFGKLLARPLANIKTEASILLAHGSRRPGSQQQLSATADSLGAVIACWAVPPSLELRVKELVAAGSRQIAILSYFLFPGGITDAIAKSVEELKLQFPGVTFQLTEPLGASAELADLILDVIQT
ncbi:sirohydrochlorin chelatase [Cylindrospermum sp. FACHB-282]|uniref:sirohydrochlorin chelatase n=1 Tax=Cylindrospermum sp. FACHB-282 TaxID=2692794 RepID=UPI0016841359|nr:sirohydrochlorin chelatase [Cylindrospermum sp. FACHB-282]MBD2386998.1 sirohydrochlorin chelatase [Cylindrospermum sp. FACHB-282]